MTLAVRVALRRLLRRPALSLTIVGLLATGIGLNATVFAILHGVAFRNLPYPDGARLVILGLTQPSCPYCSGTVPGDLFDAWERQSQSVDTWGAFLQFEATLDVRDRKRAVSGVVLVPSTLALLGAHAQVGRLFDDVDRRSGGPRRILLSDRLWRTQFGGEASIVGRSIRLDGQRYEVAGVLDARFVMPQSASADVYASPLSPFAEAGAKRYTVLARPRPATTGSQLKTELTQIASSLGLLTSGGTALTVSANSLSTTLAVREGSELAILQGLTLLVLVVTCANVAGLLVSRAQAERHVTAVHVALGARPNDIAVRALAEVLPLTLTGAVAGLGLAHFAIPVVRVFLQSSVPEWADVSVTGAVTLVTMLGAGVCALLISALPAREGFRVNLQEWVQEGSGGLHGAGRRRKLGQQTLVSLQLGIGATLLVAAGLLVTNYAGLSTAEFASDESNLMSAPVVTSTDTSRAAAAARLDAMLSALRDDPAVRRAYFVHPFFLGLAGPNDVFVDGRPSPITGPQVPTRGSAVFTRHFSGDMVVPSQGRFFTSAELDAHASDVIVVNEMLAAGLWPHQSALGRTVRVDAVGPVEGWRTVVGVVPDRHAGGAIVAGGRPDQPRFYIPFRPSEQSFSLVVQTRGNAERLLDSVGRVVERAAPHAVAQLRFNGATARDMFARAGARTALLATLATFAVLLSAVGMGALVSYSTALRRREFGVRSALGATPLNIALEVVRDAMQLSARGLVLGAAGSIVAVYVIVPVVYFNIRLPNWPVVLAIFLFMTMLTVGASLMSVMRAVRSNPADVLRTE